MGEQSTKLLIMDAIATGILILLECNPSWGIITLPGPDKLYDFKDKAGPTVAIFSILVSLTYGYTTPKLLVTNYITPNVIASFIVSVLKFFVYEPRPDFFSRAKTTEYDSKKYRKLQINGTKSFPSGHSCIVSSATLLIIIFIERILKIKAWNRKAIITLRVVAAFYLVFAIQVCTFRVLLNKHFIHDVVVGSSIGIVTGALFYRKITKDFATNQHKFRTNQ